MASDDVSLTDLEVISRFSLAVRAATAPRAQVVAALEADLRALAGRATPVAVRAVRTPAPPPVPEEPADQAPPAARPARRVRKAAAPAAAEPARTRAPRRRPEA